MSDEMKERVHGEVLAVYSDGYDRAVSDLDFHSQRIIDFIRTGERLRIRASLESEELVGMFARMLWTQDDKPTAEPSSSYYMAARYNLDAIVNRIGLGDAKEGAG